MSRVAIVGPGRVGTLVAIALTRAGHRVVAVAGGRPASRERLTGLIAGVRSFDTPADAARSAELVLLCVPDDALDQVVTDLAVADALGPGRQVVHLAGARGLGALRRAGMTGARIAACHPAMTVPDGATDPDLLVGAAWAVTAPSGDRAWAHQLVADLGGDAHDVPDDRRALYHAGLAVGSNAVGAAVATARRLLLAAQVADPGAFLAPLIRVSVDNVLAGGGEALTGPIVRGDVGTVAAHLAALDRDVPELAEAYRALSRATVATVRGALDPATLEQLTELLADPRPPLDPAAPIDPSATDGTDPGPPGPELPLHPDT